MISIYKISHVTYIPMCTFCARQALPWNWDSRRVIGGNARYTDWHPRKETLYVDLWTWHTTVFSETYHSKWLRLPRTLRFTDHHRSVGPNLEYPSCWTAGQVDRFPLLKSCCTPYWSSLTCQTKQGSSTISIHPPQIEPTDDLKSVQNPIIDQALFPPSIPSCSNTNVQTGITESVSSPVSGKYPEFSWPSCHLWSWRGRLILVSYISRVREDAGTC